LSISYKKFLKLLIDKDIKPKVLVDERVLSRSTMFKITKGEYVSLETISAICKYLNCQPGDLIEYVPDKE
jgi:putative transcriptional regulator